LSRPEGIAPPNADGIAGTLPAACVTRRFDFWMLICRAAGIRFHASAQGRCEPGRVTGGPCSDVGHCCAGGNMSRTPASTS
jgi:hypothetical protein